MRLSQCRRYRTNQLTYDMGDCGGMEAVWFARTYRRIILPHGGADWPERSCQCPSEPEANDVGFRGPKSLKYNPREELHE